MKPKTLIFLLLVVLFACKNKNSGNLSTDLIKNPATASGKIDKNKMPVITFEKTTHDFGNLIDGEVAVYSFKFTNTGKSDLILTGVIPSCGCTVPTYNKNPIHPGKSDYIEVKFDSKGRDGKFHKSITVHSNTIPSEMEIFIEGVVEKK